MYNFFSFVLLLFLFSFSLGKFRSGEAKLKLKLKLKVVSSSCPFEFGSWILFDFYERQEQQSHLLSFFICHILILVFLCCFLLLCFREVTKPTNLRKEETLTRFLNSKRERDQVEKMLAIGSPNYSVRTSTSCNALLRELQVFPLSCFLFTSFLWVSSSSFF